MTYECEFHGGHVSPINYVRDCGLFKTGLAKDERGYKRCVFFTDGACHYDSWIVAVRPATAAALYRIAGLMQAEPPEVDVTA